MDCTPPGQAAPPAHGGASAQAYSTVLPWRVPDGTHPEKGKESQEGTTPRVRQGQYQPSP